MNNVAQVIAAARKSGSTFAQSVVSQYDRRGSISEKQFEALSRVVKQTTGLPIAPTGNVETFKRKSATTQTQSEPIVRPTADALDVSRIEALFDTARSNGLKRLKFRAEGLAISPAPAGGSNPGALYVCDTGGEYLGKIKDSVYHPTKVAQPTVIETLRAIAADPLAVGVAYGKQTGKCCVCGRELTDPESIEAGIGPICQSNWGM